MSNKREALCSWREWECPLLVDNEEYYVDDVEERKGRPSVCQAGGVVEDFEMMLLWREYGEKCVDCPILKQMTNFPWEEE